MHSSKELHQFCRERRINSLPINQQSGRANVLQRFDDLISERLLRRAVRPDQAFDSVRIPVFAGEIGKHGEDLKP